MDDAFGPSSDGTVAEVLARAAGRAFPPRRARPALAGEGPRPALISPAALEALSRRHGPRQGVAGGGSALNATVIARALARAAGGTAAVVAGEEPLAVLHHPVGDELRIAYRVAAEEGVLQRRVEGRWATLDGVAVSGHPETGFELDRAALETVLGPLPAPLARGLAEAGTPPRPFDPARVRMTPERARFALDGAPRRGGGHRFGRGLPGRTEFPADWADARVLAAFEHVARAGAVSGRTRGGAALVEGIALGVLLDVLVAPDGAVLAGWPVSGPGVGRNPVGAAGIGAMLGRLVADAAARGLRAGVAAALHRAGEWALAHGELAGLAADRPDWAARWRPELAALAGLLDPA